MQAFSRIGWFVGLVLLQVLVLNHIHVGEYATPFLYIYFLLVLNADTPRLQVILWGFSLGLAVDIFSNTPGLNASAATFLAFVRNPLLRSQTGRDVAEDFRPSVRTMGMAPFFRYALMTVFLYVLFLQLADAFSFSRWMPLFWKVVTNTAATLVGIYGIEIIRRKR